MPCPAKLSVAQRTGIREGNIQNTVPNKLAEDSCRERSAKLEITVFIKQVKRCADSRESSITQGSAAYVHKRVEFINPYSNLSSLTARLSEV